MVYCVLMGIVGIEECTWMEVGEPNSLPTHMLLAEVVGGEDDRVTPHSKNVGSPTQSLSCVQLVLGERGGAVDGGVLHVNVSHSHDSPHTTLVSLHETVHVVSLLASIAYPVVARWGPRVAVENGTTRGGRLAGRTPWTHCYWRECALSNFLLSHHSYNIPDLCQV